MTFTRTNPPRFVDDRKILGQITAIAEEQLRLASDRMFIEKPEAIFKTAVALAAPASAVTGQSVSGHNEVLAALFEPAALALLENKCRNTYWFWFLLSKLATETFPVDAIAIARAHARAKDAMVDRRYGFNWIERTSLPHELKALPPGFLLEMWHTGRLLCHRPNSGDYQVILNPILIDD